MARITRVIVPEYLHHIKQRENPKTGTEEKMHKIIYTVPGFPLDWV